jgi:hypothetical protein
MANVAPKQKWMTPALLTEGSYTRTPLKCSCVYRDGSPRRGASSGVVVAQDPRRSYRMESSRGSKITTAVGDDRSAA